MKNLGYLNGSVVAFVVGGGFIFASDTLEGSRGEEAGAGVIEIGFDYRRSDLEAGQGDDFFSGDLLISLNLEGFKGKDLLGFGRRWSRCRTLLLLGPRGDSSRIAGNQTRNIIRIRP